MLCPGRCQRRAWWRTELHQSFVPVEILYPSKEVDLRGPPAHDLIARALEKYHFPIYA